MALDMDQVFERVGVFGCFQVTISILFAYMNIVNSYHALVVSFTALEPPWKCVSGSLLCNMTDLIKPGNEFYEYRCDIPRSDWEFHADYTSIVTEWDLVCSKSLLGSVATSLVFPGWIVGMLVFGTASDRYGRKPILFIAMIFAAIASIISAFSPTFWFFAMCRFLTGVGVGGSMNTCYIMCIEITGVNGRVLTTGILSEGWQIGSTLLAMIAYSLPNWHHLSMVGGISALPILITWWYVSESPRWLLVEGRHEEVREVIYQIARSNGKEMIKEKIALTHKKPKNSKNGNTLDLFRNWTIAKTSLVMFIAWFSTSLISYGTIFASVSIGGNKYVTFGILNLITLVSPPLRSAFMHKFGRKQAIITGLVLSAIAGFCLIVIPNDDSTVSTAGRIGFFIAIQLASSLAWGGVYLMTSEVFPTMTRNVGLAWCSTMARFGAFSSPYILWLRRINAAVPMSIMAGFALTAAILTFFVKDTLKAPTKETVAEIDLEAENANKQDKIEEQHGARNEGFELTSLY